MIQMLVIDQLFCNVLFSLMTNNGSHSQKSFVMCVYAHSKDAGCWMLSSAFLSDSLCCVQLHFPCVFSYFRPALTQTRTRCGPDLVGSVSLSVSGAWLDLYYKILPPLGFVSTLGALQCLMSLPGEQKPPCLS